MTKRTYALFFAAFLVGCAVTYHVMQPPDRPVLRFLVRVAKLGLWIADTQPQPQPVTYRVMHDDHISHERSL